MPAGEILDSLVGIILSILSGGYTRLSPELKSLLTTLVGLEFMFAAVAYAGAYFGAFQFFISKTIKMCIFVYLFTHFLFLSGAIIEFFSWGGLTIAGVISTGQMTLDEFHRPSIVIMKGFEATAPINTFINRHVGWGMMFNFHTLAMMAIASLLIWIGFMFATINLIIMLVGTHVVAIFALLYLVFGAFGPLAFLAERGIAMFIAAASRLGVLALITAIMFPFVDGFFLPPASGGTDPGMAEAFFLVLGTALFLIISLLIPAAVHMIAAGGPLLSWTSLVPGAAMLMGGGGGGGGGQATAAPQPPREPINPRNTMPGSAYY